MSDRNDDRLDDIFAEARAVSPPVSGDLMGRVLADAARMQRSSVWWRINDLLGGWPVLGGLTAVTVAGLWLGIAPPAAFGDLTAAMTGDNLQVSLFADASWLTLEGVVDG
ncbi:hypothetical protein [Yoonia sp. 2307UL14-13]|uniref:hypothetical protein n=1 Tax=Yoonia sp. 2307UL14-13 TaxID=3126506 RepID=UPI0030A7F9A9